MKKRCTLGGYAMITGTTCGRRHAESKVFHSLTLAGVVSTVNARTLDTYQIS